MKPVTLTLTTVAVLWSGTALATPISAISELDFLHSYTVNSGSVPDGIRLSVLPGSLETMSSATSSVDEAGATTTEVPFVQVGNPFSDPPLPFIANRVNRTTINAGTEGAQAEYNVTITSVDDPDADPFDTSIIERIVETNGSAGAFITTEPVGAAASASFLLSRGYVFENTSDRTVPFNIVGNVEASLLAGYNGSDGIARTSGNLFLEFEDMIGTTIDYLPLAPYLRTIEDDDTGASVTESLVTSDGPFDGFNFSASASAIGDGTDTEASFEATFRYIFRVEMDPGASFNMLTGVSQVNAVEYEPDISAVPLPASLPFMIAGLLGFVSLRGKPKPA